MEQRTKLAVVCAALLLASSSANAIVETWGYSITSLFTSASYSDGSGGTIAGGTSTLSWGSSPHSSLTIGNSPSIGGVWTYRGSNPPPSGNYLGYSTSLTHDNNPIGGTTLTEAVMTSSVVLTPTNPAGSQFPSKAFAFNIAFAETPNTPGTCVADSPSGNPCNDIFVLVDGFLNTSFDYDASDGEGVNRYYVNIFPIAGKVLSELPQDVCEAAVIGITTTCLGFTTAEGLDTTLAFGFTISTNPFQIPEPGALALFGLSLIGAFAARWRSS